MSLAVRPASLRAAADASAASCSSDRPEFLENSVWPMPTRATSLCSLICPALGLRPGRSGPARFARSRGDELREGDGAAVEGLQIGEGHLHGHVVLHVAGLDALQVGHETDAL